MDFLSLNDGRKEIYQWDTGRIATVEIACDIVHFSNLKYGDSLAVEVKDGEVAIPNKLLMSGAQIYCWAFANDKSGAYTKQEQTFEVIKRAKPSDYVYTETEVITIKAAVNDALEKAKENGEFKGDTGERGEDGFSPIVTVEDIDNGHRVIITDKDGAKSFDVIDGKNGTGIVTAIEMLDSDPVGEALTEGRIWILRVGDNTLTTPVIELGDVSENSIEIKLSNASHDENGDVVTTYNVYVDSVLNKTATITAGGTCVIDGLSPETEYQISVRGVKDATISKLSNTLTATTLEVLDGYQETKILAGYSVVEDNNVVGCAIQDRFARAVYVAISGNKEVPPIIDNVQYYLVELPEDAISCTVSCDGFMWGFNGWNTGSDGRLTYDVDSGWQSSGATYTFEAGAAEYVTIGFKKASAGSETITQEDVTGITVTFA